MEWSNLEGGIHALDVVKRANDMKDELIRWRRHLHSFPELSFHEKNTATFVCQELKKIPGMDVQKGVGYPTAVVGTLTSGTGPTIAIRADMDALPIKENNEVSYRSKVDGVMHACGHDAHTAIVLGTANLIQELFVKGEIKGTVKFLFQPAEEHVDEQGLSGASYMVRAGVLQDVDAAVALHMSPENQLGEVMVHDGYSMANVDVFRGKITGSGGHGAYPHLSTDPIWMLSHVLQILYGIPGRNITPLEPAVISVGKINSGKASNIIPSHVEIEGTIRSYSPEIRQRLLEQIEHAFETVKNLGGDYALKFIEEDPALYNTPSVNEFIKRTINEIYSDFNIIEKPFGLAGEDFAHIAKRIPASMFFLGCRKKEERIRPLHTAEFDIDERVLPVGTAILTGVAKKFLNTVEE